jgi:hypothetical protein
VWDERGLCWRASASGATRAGYESAISRVLRHIATEYPELKNIASDATFTELGLIARKSGPGRPKETAQTAAQSPRTRRPSPGTTRVGVFVVPVVEEQPRRIMQ